MVDKSRRYSGSEETSIDVPKEKVQQPTTWPEMIKAWPKTTFCIVSNEFCERFSYYGMRTVLTFYLLNVLKFSENDSTVFFNGFTVLCYLTPIAGSIVADGFVGKFWTIFVVSIIYASGQVILAIASTMDTTSTVHPWLDLIGLATIGVGTGGIKPCVAAFGGDQFEKGQERMLSMFFSMFYFSINAGSMISTFISPLFRSMSCMNQDSCYPLAFGIPAVLMILATCLFIAGSFWYKKSPPLENVFGQIGKIVARAIGNKFKSKESKSHWLDHYMTTHDCEKDEKCQELKKTKRRKNACHKKQYVDDIKQLFRVLIMFVPVPMFWALYDQQGSVWLIQGIEMDCRLWGDVLFLPDQVQVLNAVLILCFIPLFQVIVYPIAMKFFELTPLRKMCVGGLVAAGSFLITGFVQLQVNKTLPSLPGAGNSFVSFVNMQQGSCMMTVSPVTDPDLKPKTLNGTQFMFDNKEKDEHSFHIHSGEEFTWKLTYSGCENQNNLPLNFTQTFGSKKTYFVALTYYGIVYGKVNTKKPTEGTGEFSAGILLTMKDDYGQGDQDNMVFCRLKNDFKDSDFNTNSDLCSTAPADFYAWQNDYNSGKDDRADNGNKGKLEYYTANGILNNKYAQLYSFKSVKPGNWGIFKLHQTPKQAGKATPSHVNTTALYQHFTIKKQGGVYLFGLTSNHNNPAHADLTRMQVVQDNSLSILWQIPQIVVLTAAEILFSITGYEFAYSQCSDSMKSVVQAAWLFTTAIGDGIIVAITSANLFDNMATMFFVYSGAMAVVIIIFTLMSIFYYEYKFYTGFDEDEDEGDELDEKGYDNRSYVNDDKSPHRLEEYLETDIRF